MSYSYSNPYAMDQGSASGPVQRSTFAAASLAPKGFQLFFSGLPSDVTEKEIKELLATQNISMNTSSVKCFYGPDKDPLGMALIQVSNEDDAERLRKQYSGISIDDTFKLTVQHMLAPTQSFPSASVPAFAVPPPAPPAPASHTQRQPQKAKGAQAKPGPSDTKPPGLKLLSRLSRPGQGKVADKKDQIALLNKQKMNMKGKNAGDNLLARMAKPTGAAAKVKAAKGKGGPSNSGNVQRAKKNANMSMDVDQPLSGKGGKGKKPEGANGANGAAGKSKPGPVTQQQLDEEMRLYDRGRRFAAQE